MVFMTEYSREDDAHFWRIAGMDDSDAYQNVIRNCAFKVASIQINKGFETHIIYIVQNIRIH